MNQEIKDRIEQIRQEIIPAGYKQYRNDIFPSDWEVKQLKDIAPLQRGFDLPASKVNVGDTPVCYSNGISRYHNEYKVEGPGVVTGRSGTIGNVFYITDNFWPHNTTLWVTDFKGNLERYVYYLYKYIKLERFHAGTGVPTLNRNDVHIHKFPIPNKVDEQQKIADILSTWDRAIELKESIIKEKEEQKKGLMQSLLSSRQGWKVWKMGEIAEINTGNKDNKDNDPDGKYPFYVRSDDVLRIDSYAFDGEAILIPGDGRVGEIYHYVQGKFNYHQRVYKISDFQEKVMGKFLYYFLKQNFLREALRYSVKATVNSLRMPVFLNMDIPLPPKSEQQSIAKILSTADQEINLLKQEVEQLKEQKKGLMQLLLTGIVRVKEAVTSG